MVEAKKIAKAPKFKKRWCKIIAPKLFQEQVLGETLIGDQKAAIGRIVSINLLDLTGDMRKQHIIVKFRIKDISGEKTYTDVIGLSMMPSFTRKMVRREKDKLDQSFVAETADSHIVRIKTIMVTVSFIQASISSALRKASEEAIRSAVKKLRFEEIIEQLILYKMQAVIKKQLNKIYPLRVYEIRDISFEKEKQGESGKETSQKGVEEAPAQEQTQAEKTAEQPEENTSSEKEAKKPAKKRKKKKAKTPEEPVQEESAKDAHGSSVNPSDSTDSA